MDFLHRYMQSTDKAEQKSSHIAFAAMMDHLMKASPFVAKNIMQELKNQRSHLKMIASENFSSLAVQQAMGNFLTDKYAEGYPGHRFYAGCENVDHIEQRAVDLAKELFGVDHAYVQPHSGADANLVAFWSILLQKVQEPAIEKLGKVKLDELTDDEYEKVRQALNNQTLMGMSLNSGGHLTHGYRHNISSKMMRAVSYDVDPKTHLLDYKAIREQAKREKPLILIAGYSAYSRLINFAKMREIADEVGAVLMVDMAHFSGLVAGKVMQGDANPATFAEMLTTTTHKILRGPRGGLVLCSKEYQDIVNKGCPTVLGGPLPHVIAAKAICFEEALRPDYQEYAAQVVRNAKAFADQLMEEKVKVSTDGTDNHIVLFDVFTSFGLTGRQAEIALTEAGINVNRNAVPFDTNGAWYTSGIRVGTPALTTLGMKEEEMRAIASWIAKFLQSCKPAIVAKTGKPSMAKVVMQEGALEEIQGNVQELLQSFPLYPGIEMGEVLSPK